MTHRNPRQWLGTAGSASLVAFVAVAFLASPSSTMARSPQGGAAAPYAGCPAEYHRGGVQQTEGEGGHSFTSKGVQQTEGEGGHSFTSKGVQQTEGEGGHSFTNKGVQQTAAAQADMPCVPNQ
jgi:hypothetical protein